ncbi:MAG: T9SS type A sorting domain-containing protein [Bacteroidota bacterium]
MLKLYRFIFKLIVAALFGIVVFGSASAQRVCTNWGIPEPICSTRATTNCLRYFPNYKYKTFQDCCGARTLTGQVNLINGYNPDMPDSSENVCGAGCVANEMKAGGCGTTEHQTTWFVFDVHPLADSAGYILDSAGSLPGVPAGTLRFKIIPCDIPPNNGNECGLTLSSPPCDCNNIGIEHTIGDTGWRAFGTTDYDWALYKVDRFGPNKALACNAIKTAANVFPDSVKVSCNYSGSRGATGIFEPGTLSTQFANGTRYNKPFRVNVGDRFVLAVDDFSTNLRGCKVVFTGQGWRAFGNGGGGYDLRDSSANVAATIPKVWGPGRVTTNLCPGDSVTLSSTWAMGYRWNTGDTMQTIKVARAGEYSVQALYYNAISEPSRAFVVSYRTQAIAPVITYSNGFLEAGIVNRNYQWYLDGRIMPGYNSYAIPLAGNGAYTVKYYEADGCPSALSVPFLFTGTSADLNERLKITPNPATNTCRITGLKANALVEIYSVNGKFISAVRADSNTEIDLQGIPAGVYEIRVGHQRLSLVKN